MDVDATPARPERGLYGRDHGFHHIETLAVRQIGEFSGAAQRRKSMHAPGDEMLHQIAKNGLADRSRFIERRYQIRKDTVKRHDPPPALPP